MDHLTLEQLLDYADEQLAPPQAHDVAAHLASCPACRAELASLQRVTATLAEDNWIMPPNSARAAVQQAFRRQYGKAPASRAPLAALADWLRGLAMPRWQPALALALLLILAAALFILADEPDSVYAASATAVTGMVEAQEPESNAWRPISDGYALEAGGAIRTGEDSSLLLTFPDGSRSSLSGNTMVTLDTLQEAPRRIALNLVNGESSVHVVRSAERDARFEITTPTAAVTSAEGDFSVAVDTLETTYVRLDSGELTVSAAGRALTLGVGEEAVVMVDQPPRLQTVDEDPTPTPRPSPTLTPQPEETVAPTPTETVAPPAPVDDPGDDDAPDGDGDDVEDAPDGDDDDGSGDDDASDDGGDSDTDEDNGSGGDDGERDDGEHDGDDEHEEEDEREDGEEHDGDDEHEEEDEHEDGGEHDGGDGEHEDGGEHEEDGGD